MVQYLAPSLDVSFGALADATRRGVLERLGGGDLSMSDLADGFGMTLTGIAKHVGVLSEAGLVLTEKIGRVRTCRLGPRALDAEAAWIAGHRRLWEARFGALDAVLDELKREEKWRERNGN